MGWSNNWTKHNRGPQPQPPRGKERRVLEAEVARDAKEEDFRRKAARSLPVGRIPRSPFRCRQCGHDMADRGHCEACEETMRRLNCGVCGGRPWDMYEGQCWTCGSY